MTTLTTEGRNADPAWARPALLALLLATGAAYLIGLTANGYANAFYSAAVQAGSVSWEAFFYGSSDAGNSITVDKPPASLWVMALSVRMLGLSSFAIQLPQVLMGVASVGVVHATVKRAFGHVTGLLAGLALALTPVAVLMFRFNNPDALLTLLMVLGAWATLRAIDAPEPRAWRWMVAAGAFIGLAFLTKALQAFLVLPALGLAFVLLARGGWVHRVRVALLALAAMVVTGGWWVAVVELAPASARPWIGGSQDNSFLSVTFGYNGLGRLTGTEVGSVGGGNRGPNAGTESLLRLFTPADGGQISWLLPIALLFLVAGLAWTARAARTDPRRAGYVVWGGWLLTTGLTFSLMAGIYHEYYTVALAPAIAALVAMGARDAWERRASWLGRGVLSLAMAAAAIWGFVLLSRTNAYLPVLRYGVLVVGLAAALLWLAAHRVDRRVATAVAAAATAAALAGPAAYSVTTINTPHAGSIVTAGPATRGAMGGPGGIPGGGVRGTRGTAPSGVPGGVGGPPAGGMGGPGGAPSGGPGGMGGLLNASTPDAAVVAALSQDAASYRWVAAAVGSQNAAGLQLGTGLPVMPIGGFNGSDPSPTLAQFRQYVSSGQIHYFLSGGGFRGQNGGSDAGNAINAWVQSNFTSVTIGSATFYDLTKPIS
jgi:4-amino-4-deoxy-L-arabinose transferase-like glycosyltransferase